MNLERYDAAYLDMAFRWAQLSHDSHTKVGCLVVKDGQIIADGYNGMPSGFDNDCKDENDKTKAEVIHAEENAIIKLANSGHSAKGATFYCTHSPCTKCIRLLHQLGISRIVFRTNFKDSVSVKEKYPNIKFEQL